jgi:hypothetical protein
MNRDDPPKSLDQPWWLGKAKRQHILLKFDLCRHRAADPRGGHYRSALSRTLADLVADPRKR